jgi:hypothetical protein
MHVEVDDGLDVHGHVNRNDGRRGQAHVDVNRVMRPRQAGRA